MAVNKVVINDISIHALLAESDSTSDKLFMPSHYFYPRSPCGERQRRVPPDLRHLAISIHALLAESDHRAMDELTRLEISIHALLAESDCPRPPAGPCCWIFLSTLSLRRATQSPRCGWLAVIYFYPRSPCGERRLNFCQNFFQSAISIHALLAESDRRGAIPVILII